jgi:hypothetical protein
MDEQRYGFLKPTNSSKSLFGSIASCRTPLSGSQINKHEIALHRSDAAVFVKI